MGRRNSMWAAGITTLIFCTSSYAASVLTTGMSNAGYVHTKGESSRNQYAVAIKQNATPLSLIVRGHDIDSDDEVIVYLDRKRVGSLQVSPNRGTKTSVIDLPSISTGEVTRLSFKPKNPTWYWGVTNIRLIETQHPDIEIEPGVVDRNRYGYQYGTRSFLRQINATFAGTNTQLTLRLRGYDIDKDDEISVLLNGTSIGHLRASANNAHRVTKFSISVAAQKSANTITFRSNRKANKWGINNLLLTPVATQSGDTSAVANDSADAISPDVTVNPGDDLTAAARNAKAGDTILIKKGLYRTTRIVPRSNQTFICEQGTIISGAVVLDNAWRRSGELWMLDSAPVPSTWVSGEMKPGRAINNTREDLFIDNRLYLRVDNVSKVHDTPTLYFGEELTAGTFYQQGSKLYVASDPRNKLVEMSVQPYAIRGPHPDHKQQEQWNQANQGLADAANNVTIQNCIFEKFATHAQLGAIEAAFTDGWKLVDVTARYNHGAGLRTGRNTTVSGGSYSHNGQIGIHSSKGPCTDQGYVAFGDNLVVKGAEIAFNNWAGFYVPWEAGGIKVLNMDRVRILDNNVHHNLGKGIWTDTEVYDIVIEGNTVNYNSSIGINLEASYGANRDGTKRGRVRNNTIKRNAAGRQDSLDWIWYWGAAILVQNSRDFDINDNTVEVQKGQGIAIVNQGFGDRLCDGVWRPSINNRVFENKTLYLNTTAPDSDPNAWFHHKSGIESDDQAKNGTIYSNCEAGFTAIDATHPSANNRLYNNAYEFGDSASLRHWRIGGHIYRWDNIPSGWESGSDFNGVTNPQG